MASTLAPRAHRRGSLLVDLLLALPLAALAVFVVAWRVAGAAVVELSDDEVAVVVDHWRGTESVIDTPGYISVLPWLQEAHVLRRTPTEYRMEGDKPVSAVHAERLLVRARDGSSFWFGAFTLQYALRVDEAVRAHHDREPVREGDEAAPFWAAAVRAYARSVLRDEFGRFTAEEVVRPDNIQAASLASQRRLDEYLRPHGVEVLEISTPKPQFDRAYEVTIEQRKLANEEVERSRLEEAQLEQARERRLAGARAASDLARQRLASTLTRDDALVQRETMAALATARARYEQLLGEAEAEAASAHERAAAMRERFQTEIETLRLHAAALVDHGESAVHAEWVKRLSNLRFHLWPYARDAAPERVVHSQLTANAPGGGPVGGAR